MRFCLSNFKDFKNILITAELVLTEIKFEADNDGLRFKGFGGGNASFFSVDFKKEYFDEFSIGAPETIIVDSSEINKIMKRVKNDDDVYVSIDDYSMNFTVNEKKKFKINAIDMEYNSQDIPPMEYPISTMVDFVDFKDSINDSKLYSNTFAIESTRGSLVISANGVLGEYSSELLVGDALKNGQRSSFNSDLINSFFKLGNLSDMIHVSMGMDYPILLEVSDEFEEAVVKLLVAPRIEE